VNPGAREGINSKKNIEIHRIRDNDVDRISKLIFNISKTYFIAFSYVYIRDALQNWRLI
jgi:hypothetical protein